MEKCRLMAEIEFLVVSWQKLQKTCFKLAKKVLSKNLKFDRIVCVSRGGLVVARIFSDFFDLPISNFTIVSYATIAQAEKPKVVEELAVDIKDERILLIDEIVDRGSTLKMALSYLKGFSPKKVVSLAPFIKPWSNPEPHFWQVKTGKWVIFPYDIREAISDLVGLFKKQGKSKTKKEIEKELLSLDFDKNYINYFLK